MLADIEESEYLDIVNSKKFRIVLTKLRVSLHRLEIEMDRWSRPERIEFDDIVGEPEIQKLEKGGRKVAEF